MLVDEILIKDIAPLHLDDPVSLALAKLELLRTNKFIVVDEHKHLAGMISLQLLAEVVDDKTHLSELELEKTITVRPSQHLFETTRFMFANELSLVPVSDSENLFLGLVRKRELLNALGDIFNLSTFGSVLSIEMDHMDYTLSDIVRIIETEGAKILGVAVQQPDYQRSLYRVSIKIDMEDSSVVSAALRRYGYLISSEENSASMEDNFSDRADELIRYLDI